MNGIMKGWMKVWLYALCAISVALLAALAVNWNGYNWAARLSLIGISIIGFHSVEEERLPGGFMYMFNSMQKSDMPDRYPMNEFVAMLVDVSATLAFAIIFFACNGAAWFGVSIAIFCTMEPVIHTVMGIANLKKFRSQGKKTIYVPGLATAYLGFLPVAIALWVLSVSGRLSALEWVAGIVTAIIVLGVCVRGIETVFSDKDTPYIATRKETYGYFLRFQQ